MEFSTPTELQTLSELRESLAPLGYLISQKVRVLDCLEAVAANPDAGRVMGPTAADYVVPLLRQNAGPFGPNHPWLRLGDHEFAFRSHFDFVVQAPIDDLHPTHPLFAVEFDGGSHRHPETIRRDLIKNRLCAASGLPLVRLDQSFLHRRERLTLVRWLADLWAAYRAEMPHLLAERDAAAAMISEEEKRQAGIWLLAEHPELDTEWLFKLKHPFPPAVQLAERLADRHGFYWFEVPVAQRTADPRWRVGRWLPPVPSLESDLTQRWSCELTLSGPSGKAAEVRGLADVRTAYPLNGEAQRDPWDALLEGQPPYLPAGPWLTAPSALGEALCVHNTLIEVAHWLNRNDTPGK